MDRRLPDGLCGLGLGDGQFRTAKFVDERHGPLGGASDSPEVPRVGPQHPQPARQVWSVVFLGHRCDAEIHDPEIVRRLAAMYDRAEELLADKAARPRTRRTARPRSQPGT